MEDLHRYESAKRLGRAASCCISLLTGGRRIFYYFNNDLIECGCSIPWCPIPSVSTGGRGWGGGGCVSEVNEQASRRKSERLKEETGNEIME